MNPTTAVIGVSISGLTSSKMLTDYGVPHTVFESSDRVGGNWAFGNPNGHQALTGPHIDTSKHQLSFRDFLMPMSTLTFRTNGRKSSSTSTTTSTRLGWRRISNSPTESNMPNGYPRAAGN